ncbi:molybdopterin synthase [Synchytrium microbalum]|uniref:Molybdopterin synthase n=1 Tax=Synchytrium microbalum TaxID=1806994 RepID=A0A507C5C0_9FUNG|nr:molybdopterin synthase [Synchytrium microbalum]TPX32635.1 molybdopterin synthase [Synchytrium microbalum]
MTESTSTTGRDRVTVTESPLDLSAVLQFVRDDGAGAIATFSGTTRNFFIGKLHYNLETVTERQIITIYSSFMLLVEGRPKNVTTLEYEAYIPMAIKELHKCITKAREQWPSLVSCAIHHRIGPVAIGLESVIIAVSAPHRADAIHASEFLIDDLKANVPIWKKEFYEDGSVWKENAESRRAVAK